MCVEACEDLKTYPANKHYCVKRTEVLWEKTAAMWKPQGAKRCKELICDSNTHIQKLKNKHQGLLCVNCMKMYEKNIAREMNDNKTRISQTLFAWLIKRVT